MVLVLIGTVIKASLSHAVSISGQPDMLIHPRIPYANYSRVTLFHAGFPVRKKKPFSRLTKGTYLRLISVSVFAFGYSDLITVCYIIQIWQIDNVSSGCNKNFSVIARFISTNRPPLKERWHVCQN